MEFEKFITLVRHLPVIETEIMLAGIVKPGAIKVQISRWEKSGKLIQLKRGIYVLADAYRKVELYEPYIASLLKMPSYISLEKALEYHGVIPEAVPVYSSVTTKRQARFDSKIGLFNYRHIKTSLFWGYKSLTINNQTAFMATAEKALLDFLYLNHIKISLDYLAELRLQNVDKINPDKLFEYAKRFHKPGMMKAAEIVKQYVCDFRKGEKIL